MIYLTLPELLRIAERVIEGEVKVRDHGLLESTLARPQASAFGQDAYQNLDDKAAALLHSLARNHALIDGTQTAGIGGVDRVLRPQRPPLTLTNVAAYDLVRAVASGALDDVEGIAAALTRTTPETTSDHPTCA